MPVSTVSTTKYLLQNIFNILYPAYSLCQNPLIQKSSSAPAKNKTVTSTRVQPPFAHLVTYQVALWVPLFLAASVCLKLLGTSCKSI